MKHLPTMTTTMAALATLGALTLSGLQLPGSPAAQHAAGQSAAAWTGGSLTSAVGMASRPNVLVFTADDATVSDLEQMPNVRRLLVARGTTMTEAIAPTPICVPSRASLLTGQYAHNHGALTIAGRNGGFASFRDAGTLPTWLRRAGYDTIFAGKYLNGYGEGNSQRYVPPGWSDWFANAGVSTYSFFNSRYNRNGRVAVRREHQSDVLGTFTAELIGRRARLAKPWFAWVNFVAPHQGGGREADDPAGMRTTTPARRHRNVFRSLPLPTHPEMLVGGGSPWSGTEAVDATELREVYQQRLESLQSVDEAVGRAVSRLTRSGQLANTYVVFTSDNGYLVGHHNRVGKLMPYDRSLRVPLVVRGPGIPAGRSLATPTTVPDLAVTIAAIAGARPTRTVDGVDMREYWRSGTTYDRIVPIEAYPVRDADVPLYTGIRRAQYTYVTTPADGEVLFDRATDPGELRNVAAEPGYEAVLTQMRDWESQYRGCAGASCPGPSTFTAR